MADDVGHTAPRGHRHTLRCYWDLTECRWVCRPAADVAPPPVEDGERQQAEPEPAPAS
jgi:hypothetical protein